MHTALTIAGSDPSGGAGLQADLQVFRSFGVHGAGVLTALTVQDDDRVHQVLPVFPSVVLDQIRILLRSWQPDAVKIGMLGSDDVVRNVLLALADLDEQIPVIIDPVLQASDGTALLERRAHGSLCALFARAQLVTPNLSEAETLTGCDVSTVAGAEAAARAFVDDLGAAAALVKGGHRAGAPDDVLAQRVGSNTSVLWLKGERIEAGRVHGTGCALSSAIAAGMAKGDDLETAIAGARRFVAEGLRHAAAPGAGARFLVHP